MKREDFIFDHMNNIINVPVKVIEYLGNGEASVELNTGEVADIFYNPHDGSSVYIEDITGTIGEWLSSDTSDIPNKAIQLLHEVYMICVKELG